MTGTVQHRSPTTVPKRRAVMGLPTGYKALMPSIVEAEIHADVIEPLAVTLIRIEEY